MVFKINILKKCKLREEEEGDEDEDEDEVILKSISKYFSVGFMIVIDMSVI